MTTFSQLPFTERLIDNHPSLAYREVSEVALTFLFRNTPKKILSRGKEEKAQTILTRTFNELLDSTLDDPSVNVLQIGAHDGLSDDPLSEYFDRTSWNAVLVEPTELAFQALSELRGNRPNTTLINKAVTPNGDTVSLFVPVVPGFEKFSTVWTNTKKEQVEREIKRNLGWHMLRKSQITELILEGISPKELLSSNDINPSDLQIVVCDVEGQDPPIIDALLDTGTKPKILMYEHFHADETQVAATNERLLDEGFTVFQSVKDTLAYQI